MRPFATCRSKTDKTTAAISSSLADMSTMSAPARPAASRAMHGIGCVILGMLFFAGQDAMMKSLLLDYPIWLLLFIRSCVAVAVLVPLILLLGAPHRLRSPLWPMHLLRAALFAVGFSLFYTAFPFMGLAQVTTIFFSAPLMIGVMAAVFLKERLGAHRIAALIVGFVGVVIAIDPGGERFSGIALLPLLCALFYAASQVLARKIGETETSLTVGLFTLAFTGPIALAAGFAVNALVPIGPDFPHLGWHVPPALTADWPALLLLGGVGMVGYILLSRGYQVADASVIAPFDYSYLPMAALIGWLLWGEVPQHSTLVGMVLIVGSGLYMAGRELRAARRHGEPVVMAETVIAPLSPHPQKIPDDQTWP